MENSTDSKEKFLNTSDRITVIRKDRNSVKALNTMKGFRETYPDSGAVLDKIFMSRLSKTSNKCPKCGNPPSKHYKRMKDKMAYMCKFCKHRVYPLVNTPLERAHVPLNDIMELIYRMIISKHGLTAAETAKEYGYKYDTALKTLHRIRIWMGLFIKDIKFSPDGIIEADEVYIKKPTGLGRNFSWSRGMGSERIQPVITFVERGGPAKAFVVDEATRSTIKTLVSENLSMTNKIRTDEKNIYHFLTKAGYDHDFCVHNKKQYVNGDTHTNSAEGIQSYMKANITHTHKGVSAQHMQKYIDEVVFKYSTRFDTIQDALKTLFTVLPPLF